MIYVAKPLLSDVMDAPVGDTTLEFRLCVVCVKNVMLPICSQVDFENFET